MGDRHSGSWAAAAAGSSARAPPASPSSRIPVWHDELSVREAREKEWTAAHPQKCQEPAGYYCDGVGCLRALLIGEQWYRCHQCEKRGELIDLCRQCHLGAHGHNRAHKYDVCESEHRRKAIQYDRRHKGPQDPSNAAAAAANQKHAAVSGARSGASSLPAASTSAAAAGAREPHNAARLLQPAAAPLVEPHAASLVRAQPAAAAGAPVGARHSESAGAAAAEGSARSRLSMSAADRCEPPLAAALPLGPAHPAAAVPSAATAIVGVRENARPADEPQPVRAQSSVSPRSVAPSVASAAEAAPAADADKGRSANGAADSDSYAHDNEGIAAAARDSAAPAASDSQVSHLLATAVPSPEIDDSDLARISAAVAAASAAAISQLPELRQLLDERIQLMELRLQHQSFKRRAEADLQEARAAALRERDAARKAAEERDLAQRETASLREQLIQRAAECARLESAQSALQRETAEQHQSLKRKAGDDLAEARRERDAAVAAAATAKSQLKQRVERAMREVLGDAHSNEPAVQERA